MSGFGLALVALTIFIAALGSLTQLYPGNALILIGAIVWAIWHANNVAWVYASVVTLVFVASFFIKWIIPGRYMLRHGVSTGSFVAGVIAGIAGFFLIPLIGLPIGFVLGVYGFAMTKTRSTAEAWKQTKVTLKGVLGTVIIELITTVLAGGIWVLGIWHLW